MSKTKARKGEHPIKFGTPPERRDYHWAEVAERLRARPGEWALVHERLPASVAWSVNAGRVGPVHKDRGFRTRTVGNTQGAGVVRTIRELWMVYDPALDTTIKKNGAKK